MRLQFENLGNKTVFTATLHYNRSYSEGAEPVERFGKFYLMNAGDLYIIYGIWGSREGIAKHSDNFEKSARTIMLQNMTAIDLDSIFENYITDTSSVTLADGSTLLPPIIASGTVEGVRVDEGSNSVSFQMNDASDNGFLVLESDKVLRDR